jgi:hypothetical protein
MTPIYEHPFYQQYPWITQARKDPFSDVVEENTSDYAASGAFATAFFRQALHLMDDNWAELSRAITKEDVDWVGDAECPVEVAIEEFLKGVRGDIAYALDHGVDQTTVLEEENIDMIPYIDGMLTTLCKPDIDKQAFVTFLFSAAQREGVIVGFTDGIIQGRILSDYENTTERLNIIHSSPEIAIHPPSGKIHVDGSVAAGESLGEYEDSILTSLGIL